MADPLAALSAGDASATADLTNVRGQTLAVAPESRRTQRPVLRSLKCGLMSGGLSLSVVVVVARISATDSLLTVAWSVSPAKGEVVSSD